MQRTPRTIEVRTLFVGLGYLLLIGAGTVVGITIMMTLAVYFRRPEGAPKGRRAPITD